MNPKLQGPDAAWEHAVRRCSHWLVDHPDSIWAEDYVMHEPATEREARAAYRADHGLPRLPRGTVFYRKGL